MAYVTVEIDPFEVIGDLSDEDLILEMKSRDIYNTPDETILRIYEAKKLGKDYENLLDELIYDTIGRF